ncbi:MAG: phospholipase D-like domain-containing protein, partial [Pseudomonadota bacterium]
RIAKLRARRASLRRLRKRLDARAAAPHASDLLALVPDAPTLHIPDQALTILADPPGKALAQASGTVAPALMALLATARREALIISPYFVPGRAGTALLAKLVASGVRVSVITNSLAATDVVAVHGGYVRYRAALLAAGIELHEIKASEDAKPGLFGSKGASLHTKAVMVDDGPLFVGSFNMDPRSAALNTEMGVMLDHRGLARLLRRQHRRLADGGRSWRVQLQGGRMVWTDGRGPPLLREPAAAWRRRLVAWIMRWLPVESQL